MGGIFRGVDPQSPLCALSIGRGKILREYQCPPLLVAFLCDFSLFQFGIEFPQFLLQLWIVLSHAAYALAIPEFTKKYFVGVFANANGCIRG